MHTRRYRPLLTPYLCRIIRLNVKITGYSGLSVIWDNEQLVQIIAPGALKNALCGLCGTFNDRAADDYVPKNSKVYEDDSNIFALSWQVGSQDYLSKKL